MDGCWLIGGKEKVCVGFFLRLLVSTTYTSGNYNI